MKSNNERVRKLFRQIDSLSYIDPDSIPDIHLYMDQVTTFMDERLEKTKRYPEDKILTKTMINNYAKNNLLPPPVKKKYTKEHMLMLIYIYYFKNVISFRDIEQLFQPLTQEHFSESAGITMEDIYREVFTLEKEQMQRLKVDVLAKLKRSHKTFDHVESDDREYLKLFAFICELSFDVYLKRQMIESLIDQLREEADAEEAADKKRGKKKHDRR